VQLLSFTSSRENLFNSLRECRQLTLALIEGIDQDTFSQQAHADFSPVGWHLGHIAYTEAYWILEQCAGFSPQFSQYHQLFAADGLPKSQRQNLPSIEAIFNYLATIREQVITYLEIATLETQARLWHWLLQHESQHNETIAFILQLHQLNNSQKEPDNQHLLSITAKLEPKMLKIPASEFILGNDTIEAQDNERIAHRVYLDSYWLDAYPVTCYQYRQFMANGGYKKREFWSELGWQWLQKNPLSCPLYWTDFPHRDNHPVCGVSWYEAEAYAKFAGKRLPTELEWEKAASWHPETQAKYPYPWGKIAPNPKLCNYNAFLGQTTPVTAYPTAVSPYGCYDLLGNVWEWTASWFTGYHGFQPYPYPGYSQVYFDQQHRVLRGGSWATRSWGLRNSFRNWYHPWTREIFAGFRCAKDE
jgi:ergothioneine biosynthesis protein EgtB